MRISLLTLVLILNLGLFIIVMGAFIFQHRVCERLLTLLDSTLSRSPMLLPPMQPNQKLELTQSNALSPEEEDFFRDIPGMQPTDEFMGGGVSRSTDVLDLE